MKQQDHSTPWIDETPLPIPDAITFIVERILDGRDRDTISYSRHANAAHVDHCVFCGALVLPCVLTGGRTYNAMVYVDHKRDEKLWVDIYRPHACAGSIRLAEFLSSKSEEDTPEFFNFVNEEEE